MQTSSCCYLTRALAPSDEPLLVEFFNSHSRETVYQRYGYIPGKMSPSRAQALLNVDEKDQVALGVFESDFIGERLVAVGRFCRRNEVTEAELALVVKEGLRRNGIATMLLNDLAKLAVEKGMTHFRAQVFSENEPMRHLLGRYDPRILSVVDARCLDYRVSLKSILSRPLPEEIGRIMRFAKKV